jgi:molybdate transport system substrate-binding protein
VPALLFALLVSSAASADEIQVAAAASLQDAVRVIAANYQRSSNDRVLFNFAGSNVLALQIRAGAPVDVFLAADEKTMNSVDALVTARRPLLSNTLVVVSNIRLGNPRELLRARRIALGDPNAVPAGVYAREYLQRIGLWRDLLPKIVPMENVRAALAAVDGGNVDAAIVYKTDATLARHARVAFEITGPDAPHIVYPVAIVRASRHPAAARRFFVYLTSSEAAAVFRRFGFVTLPPTRPASSRSVGTISRPPARPRS